MSESQSRYSIIERLNRTKLDLIGAHEELQNSLRHRENILSKVQKDFDSWKEDVTFEQQKAEREHTRKVEDATRDLENFKTSVTEKNQSITKKLDAVEAALKQIESISREAAKQENS